MKKKDKQFLNEINSSLSTLNENEKLPEVLSEENIAAVVDNQEQSKRAVRTGRQKRITALASCAAVAVLSVCGVLAYKAAKNPSAVVPPPSTTESTESQYGDAPLYTVSSYSVIEQRFEKRVRQIAEEMKSYAVKNEVAAEGVTGAAGTNSSQAPDSQASGSASTDDVVIEGGAGGAGGAGDEERFSSTNVQVNGVDEADIIKNDGKYLYVVSSDFEYVNKPETLDDYAKRNAGAVKIVDTQDPSQMKVVSSVLPTIPNGETTVREIYVKGNNLVLVCNAWEYVSSDGKEYDLYRYGYGDARTLVVVYDITDRAQPREKGRYQQSGFYFSSRLIDNRVYVLSSFEVNIYNKNMDTIKKDCIPMYGENGSFERIPVEDISIMRSGDRTNYLVVGSINFHGDELTPTVKAVLGGGEEAYCTGDMLYVSNSVYDYSLYTEEELNATDIAVDMGRTEIFSFLLNEGRIEYKSYGTVSGIINDQFSMDEYKGYFRIATTVGWNGYSIVTVLDKNLQRVGELTKIAKGEEIYAVRFIGDTAYVVTFENTDPLFVIDLSDPTKPEVVGELKIPGFSDYLYPINEKYILGIGEDRDEEGQLIDDEVNTKLSVFDVSDPYNPQQVSTLVLRGGSAAQETHKALTVLGNGSFLIPMRYNLSDEDTARTVQFSVSEYGRIRLVRSYTSDIPYEVYDNNSDDEDEEPRYYYYNDIERSVFTDSTVFSVGWLYVEAYSMDNGQKLGQATLVDSKKIFERDREEERLYEIESDTNGDDILYETTEAAVEDTEATDTTAA